MSDLNDKSNRRIKRGKPSGPTRRIVVEDLPPEQKPKSTGRKLESPEGLDPSVHAGAQQDPTNDSPSTPHQETMSAVFTPGHAQQPEPVVASGQVESREPINVKRLVLIVVGLVAVPALVVAIVLVFTIIRRQSARDTVIKRELGNIETTGGRTPSADGSQAPDVTPPEVREMTIQLVYRISQKSGYEFAPDFVEKIRERTHEYISANDLLRARKFRREINKSFRDEELHPLVGYSLALSRSNFDSTKTEKGIGLWQIPLGVARSQGYIGANENDAKLRAPEYSAEIAASYTKELFAAFEADDFIYAIACFGMTREEAGRVQSRLIKAAPNAKERRDVMKIIQAGVLADEQVETLTRFFAAGIVGENPRKFGLTNSEPFSLHDP